MRWTSLAVAGVAVIAAGCASVPPPPPAPPPPPPVVYEAPDTVWTARPAVAMRRDSASVSLARALTRLDVVGADSASLRVRCATCPDTAAGWVARSDVLDRAATPDSAATGSLAEFALALRAAAARHDLEALRLVMADDFSFGSIGAYGRDRALSSWASEGFQSLDLVPGLLDAGLTPLGEWWVAPVDYASGLGYRGLRLGVHRAPTGRWEWVFLVRGEAG